MARHLESCREKPTDPQQRYKEINSRKNVFFVSKSYQPQTWRDIRGPVRGTQLKACSTGLAFMSTHIQQKRAVQKGSPVYSCNLGSL